MAMTQEHFEALVGRLEDEAEISPRLYKFRLLAFAALGYAYVIGILALLGAAVAAIAYVVLTQQAGEGLLIKLGVPIVVLIGIVIKALWIRLDPPTGLWLTRKKHPELFAAIDEIRKAAAAPRAHVVLMTDELNAAIVQTPRLGLFGWQKNHLLIGLPLMQLLSPDEFRAVVAHEFGHLSAAHGRFSAWIYRIRAGWLRLHRRLQDDDHWGRFLFLPFFSWFVPKFSAYSFVQARQHEYEADQVAAEVIGAAPLTNALLRIQLKAQELERQYWPHVYASAAEESAPSVSPYMQLGNREHREWQPDAVPRMKEALMMRSEAADTHPSLNERIIALRETARLPNPPDPTAAQYLLGASLESLAEYFDSKWRRNIAGWWGEKHEQLKSRRQQLAAMRGKPIDSMSDDELAALARATEEIEGPKQAYPLYLTLAKRPSNRLGARHAVGRLLLRSGNEKGRLILDQIMKEDPNAILPASEIIIPYLLARGRRDEAASYIARYQKLRSELQQAQALRYRLRATDEYVCAQMTAASRARIQQVLGQHKGVKSAYLAQKAVADGQAPLFVVGIVPTRRLFSPTTSTADRELCEAIASQVRIPEETLFVPLNARSAQFKKKLTSMAGTKIFG
jgi:Zn-dependent protease with chaperone function